MNRLEEQELIKIEGGAKYGVFVIIGGAITFIIGFVNGILRPKTCSSK